MIIKIVMGFAVIVGGFLLYVGLQKPDYTIYREIVINSSPENIYPHLNNSKLSNAWMPWEESDPEMKIVYSGPEEGVGSKSSWTSKGKMGTGESLVVESEPNQFVKTKLSYIHPMEMEQLATLSLTPKDAGTLVRWEVTGENSFMGRIMCVFFDMDEMVGKEFNKGLARLKQKAETVSLSK